MSAAEHKKWVSPVITTVGERTLSSTPSDLQSASRVLWFTLTILFATGGCAALIYEIVWFQMLQLVIGSTAVSLGVLLASFMGGMCLGSIFLPRLAPARKNPVRVWA